jgi:hypothetical protein
VLNLQIGDFKVWQDLRLELLHIVLTHEVADYKNDECFFVRANHVQMMMIPAKDIKMMAVQPVSETYTLTWLSSQKFKHVS